MKNKVIFIILLSCFHLVETLAGIHNYTFHTLSPEGGFYYDGVKEIVHDKDGFVWIMMDYELYRFDGYEYKRFYTSFPEWSTSIEWIFNDMVVDGDNNFYVATNDGLYIYANDSESFTRLIKNNIHEVSIGSKGELWVQLSSKHWGVLDMSTLEIIHPTYKGKQIDNIRHILPSETNELFLLSNYGVLYRYDYGKQEIVLKQKQESILQSLDIITYATIDKGKLWVIANNRNLLKIDLTTLQIEDSFLIPLGKNNLMREIHIAKDASIWIASIRGLFILDQTTRNITQVEHKPNSRFSLPNNSIWTIKEDLKGNLWIGTYAGGLCYVNLDEKSPFKTYISKPEQLNNSTVSAFVEDDEYLWIGTEGGGLNRMNKETKKFDYFVHREGIKSLSNNNIKSLILDNKNQLWIGTFRGGIDCLDTKTLSFKNFQKDENNPDGSLIVNNIRKLVEEKDAGIWIAYQEQSTRISFLSYKDHSIQHYNLSKDNSEQFIFDMLRDKNNNLWILTRQKLFRMNVNTKETQEIIVSKNTSFNGQTFCLDMMDNLWIGTTGKGLIEYNIQNASSEIHDEVLNYNTSSIYSLLYDSNHAIWIGTDNGLFKYDIANKLYSQYDEHDGTQGLVYYPLAAYQGKNDLLYFGGTSGFSIIEKNNLKDNTTEAKAFLTDFMIDNIPTKLSEVYDATKNKILLTHNQANFSFKFSSDNYLLSEKNKFKYRLKGYDKRWITVESTNRLASYAKVPAGEYTFEILTANNDGVWSTSPTKINIKRKTAPWFSWPAYTGYLLLFLLGVFFMYRYYTEKKKLSIQLYLEGVEKSKRESIHEAQLRFFTNISHDFRTPLSLIIGVVDRLRSEGLKEYYYRILHGNAQRLLNLVNELMDFRSVESNSMALEVEETNIYEFVMEICSSFLEHAKQENIEYNLPKQDISMKSLYIDHHIMEKVLMNLLNNAFKYTKSKGKISVSLYPSDKTFKSSFKHTYTMGNTTNADAYFSIVVSDTGIGISKDSISKVFERFYKVPTINFDSHLGTGIGLALVKSLTLLHKGYITIYSEREKGTDIEVCFPFYKESYTSAELKVSREEEVDDLQKENKTDAYILPDYETEGLVESNRPKILIAEDNEDLRRLIKDYLSSDYDIIEAEDGLIASDLLDKNDIDLIISDIMMPRKDGISLCSDVKNSIDTSHIPFIILSAKTTTESKIEGVDSGADIYFDKPIDFELLKLSVNNIFKQREILRDHYAKNYYAESSELSMNEKDNEFLKDFIQVIDSNIDKPELDVSFISTALSMSRSKLYKKIKGITGKSIVEFILNYKMRKAARLIIEEDFTMREVMTYIGIESQPYFTNAFKKEFGKTPTQFAAEHKSKANEQKTQFE